MTEGYVDDGKFKIILRLEEVPDFTIVTKPTGTKAYEVKRKLPVYPCHESLKLAMSFIMPDWCVYLTSADGVEVEFPETKVAVHFNDFDEMLEFVNELDSLRETE